MMIGFWVLTALFIAGLSWFGIAANAKRQCEFAPVLEGRRHNAESNRFPGIHS